MAVLAPPRMDGRSDGADPFWGERLVDDPDRGGRGEKSSAPRTLPGHTNVVFHTNPIVAAPVQEQGTATGGRLLGRGHPVPVLGESR